METIDQATEMQEAMTEYAIKAIRDKVKTAYIHTGHCFYCEEHVHSPHLFCDLSCRDDWEKEQRLRQIAGKRR